MEFAGALLGLSLLAWSVVFLRVHNVFAGSVIFLIATTIFPPEYLKLDVAGLSLTIDRAWLLIVAGQFTWDLYCGKTNWRNLTGSDAVLFLFLSWLIVRTLTTPIGKEIQGQPSTVMHLINGYLAPVFLYFLMRHSRLKPIDAWPAIGLVLIFGVYLSITAVLEITKQWSLVWPPFIADPTLGIHFGRARGPMLQSVRLGMCLCLCLAILWAFVLRLNPNAKWAWLTTFSLTPLFLLGILLTYTRSIWMGTIAVVVILMSTLLVGKTRAIALGALVVSGAMGGLILGPSLVAFKREYSEAETLESTKMRGAFAYVSVEMFKDRPITGFGFNQFQVHNRPYLDDRRTSIRLESIRGYVHHNSYLSLLVDLGLIGVILFAFVAWSQIRNGWTLLHHPLSEPFGKSAAILGFCMLAVHAIQMAFHEVSFSSIEYTILAFSLGMVQVYRDELIRKTELLREASTQSASTSIALMPTASTE